MSLEVLRTDRLVGRAFEESDFDDYARLFADERVGAALGGTIDREQAHHHFEVGRAHWRAHGFGIWSFREHDGAYVGRGGLRHCIVDGRAEIELAYSLCPEQWGRGFATELARASAEAAFAALGLAELVAFTYPRNTPSQRVLAKAGFVREREGVRHGEPHVFYRLRAGAS
jgi:RimJ/RimL family protein N-acetyltransferase